MDLEILIAEKAKKVKQNLLKAYFEEKREQYFLEFIDADPDSYDDLYNLKRKVDAMITLEQDINNMIEGGKLAEHTTGE